MMILNGYIPACELVQLIQLSNIRNLNKYNKIQDNNQSMKKRIIVPITPSTYDKLPNSQPLETFLKFLKNNGVAQQAIKNSYFVQLFDVDQVYVMIGCCFGGSIIVDKIKKMLEEKGCDIQNIHRYQQIMTNFNYNIKLDAYDIFKHNLKHFGQNYPYFHDNIFRILSDKQCYQLFKQVQNQCYLQRVKIRIWSNNKKISRFKEQYRKFKRNDEDDQIIGVNDSTYLIWNQNQDGTYNVGMICAQNVDNMSQIKTEKQNITGSDKKSHIQSDILQIESSGQKLTLKKNTTTIQEKQVQKSCPCMFCSVI